MKGRLTMWANSDSLHHEPRFWLALAAVVFVVTQLDSARCSAAGTKVVMVRPPNGAKGVDWQTALQLHFSNGLTLDKINANSVRLLGPGGKPVPGKLGSDIQGDVVSLLPNQRLS